MTPPDSGEVCKVCGRNGCYVPRSVDCLAHAVSLPSALAQRILAALERAAVYEPTLRDDYAEIAAELRAIVERKP